jgi:hypothetical protein
LLRISKRPLESGDCPIQDSRPARSCTFRSVYAQRSIRHIGQHPNAIGFLPPNQSFGSGPHNLNRLKIFADTPWSLLDTTNAADPLEVHTTYAVVNQVRGYVNPPSAVYKDNVLQTQGVDWTHDAAAKTIEFASGAPNAKWTIVP